MQTNHESAANIIASSKDSQTIISVLKDMGIEDYEPKIINQLLELSYSIEPYF